MRRVRLWALLADTIPLYPLYALLFADVGLSDAEISALFVVWSVSCLLAEVPSGALADRFSRRGAVAAGGVFQAAGYLLWTAFPGFWMFAAGFALWALGGALVSGALEALLYDGMAAAGQAHQFTRVYGQVNALELIAQLPAALAATVLFAVGEFALVGWVSVGMCLTAAAMALRIPETPPYRAAAAHGVVQGGTVQGGEGQGGGEPDGDEDARSGLTLLREGAREALGDRTVRGAVLAVALLGSLDGIEEYFGLMASSWDVPTGLVPLAVLGIPMAGALGAACAGGLRDAGPWGLAGVLGAGVPLLALAAWLAGPPGLLGVAVFYALYRAVLVVGKARLQERIESTARATVTSFAGLGTELVALLVYGAWAFGGLPGVTALAVLVALTLPYGLRRPAERVAALTR
ncbi:MFS transporter [Saccharomonospora saliphila]|uniref:MFS transporter n=1 Tax=Saccharomonospora saliphila TaxID=369829 RepID=UPI0003AB1082|nr:MFS transporter [Saccharomonospora saliphila]